MRKSTEIFLLAIAAFLIFGTSLEISDRFFDGQLRLIFGGLAMISLGIVFAVILLWICAEAILSMKRDTAKNPPETGWKVTKPFTSPYDSNPKN